MSSISHAIVGLPGSGKTTYLGALWHLIDSGEIKSEFVLERLVGDNTYLNDVAEMWRRCEQTSHTSLSVAQAVSIHVRQVPSGTQVNWDFQDVSGETFQQQFHTRSCSESYVRSYGEAGGILLFITANRVQDGLTINDINSTIDEVPDEHVDLSTDLSWSYEAVPDQVKLVELLQFVCRPPFIPRKRHLAIVISAWDVISDPSLTPDGWLRKEMPLLWQFIFSNSDRFISRMYGISAQGGDVADPTEKARLLKMAPSQRILCIGEGALQHDLTAPLAWLSTEKS